MILSPRQRKAARKIVRLKGAPIWWRVGCGKTRIALKAFAIIAKRVNRSPNFFVVCRREAFFDWQRELRKCELPWKVYQVEEEQDIYRGLNSPRPRLYLLSHGKLARLIDPLVDYGSLIDGIAFDEGFLYKNPTTEHCQAANRLSSAVGFATILSGSMMTAKDLTDVYGQFYAISRHEFIARNLTAFRSKYMHRFVIRPNESNHQAAWINAKGSGERLANCISSECSIYFPPDDKRRIVESVERIPATDSQTTLYKELREYYEFTVGKERVELKNAPSVMIKAQQISDGWVQMKEEWKLVPSQKLDYLIEKVAELIACGEKVVIWCAFINSVQIVLQRLQSDIPSLERNTFAMSGKHKFDERGWYKRGLVAVCTEASGSSVNHFAQCPYAIYYSMDCHWLHLQQSRGRNNRTDSRHDTCYYYHLETKGSMDAVIRKLAVSSGNKEKHLINQIARKEVTEWLRKTK